MRCRAGTLARRAGQSQVDVDQDELDAGVVGLLEEEGANVLSGSSELEDSDTAWSRFGGYRLSPYFAVEAGYQDLGTITYGSSGTIAIPGVPGTFPASVNIDFESSGLTLAGVGSGPLGESVDLHVASASSSRTLRSALESASMT
jgi:OmpA-OmpF porin, OOP family